MIIDCEMEGETKRRRDEGTKRSCKMGTTYLAIVRQLTDNRLTTE